ncbi:DJ-1/PfpI family protein [Chitinimonas lacunae]|uniref:DJ-1/PfpI family protein n=1 Tax=Chitinimonas lacunae TaxID=1963018 RepID=A0ABV8MUB2_9NEIS
MLRLSFLFLLCSMLCPLPALAASPGTVEASPVGSIPPYQARLGRTQPVVAVVSHNAGTELSDFVVPYGILSRSGAAEVWALAPAAGPIVLHPTLKVEAQATLAQFDQRFPQGADYVIVPAVTKPDEPALLDWLKSQAGKGATIVSICDGALVVAQAGLFKGYRATGHWATQAQREKDFPDTVWLRDVRYVADRSRISSAGVSAAIPLSLALVEAIAGPARAAAVATEVGVKSWDSRHDSHRFRLGFGLYLTGALNYLFSRQQDIGLPVSPGVDEIALALSADAFSRTYRSRAYAVAATPGSVRTRHGLTLLPDRVRGTGEAPARVMADDRQTPSVQALDRTLQEIGTLYGADTARLVAVQLEYPWQP